MSWIQIRAVGATFFANSVDGFDILAITFAAPGIAREWLASPLALGSVISAGLAGMAIGSLVLGPLADRQGRRPVIFSAILTIAVGMLLSAFAPNIVMLGVLRFGTGIAIGTMMGPLVIATAEHANERRRNFCLGLMSVGVPIGGMVGGTLAIVLLDFFDWRAIFLSGSILTFIAAGCVFFFLPESIPFLMDRRPRGFVDEVTRQMARMGHAPIEIPPLDVAKAKPKHSPVHDPVFRKTTAILCLIFLGHIVTFYYLVGWMPKMVVDAGYSESQAAGVSTIFNGAGLVGQILLGVVKGRNGLIGTLLVIYVGTAVTVFLFGWLPADLGALQAAAGLCGFFASAGVIGTYALVIGSFEVRSRSTGLGMVIGFGRGASAIAPTAAGALFAAGGDRTQVSLIFGAGSVLAALSLLLFAKQLGSFRDPRNEVSGSDDPI